MPLNDKEIRPFLIDFINKKNREFNKVIEELPVCFGNAIADVVSSTNKTLHCFEIKGETDSISRIQHQALYYNQAFKKISLVTTTNHVNYAFNAIPQYWGILLAEYNKDNKIIFKQVRKATSNPKFSKEIALHTLWKDELLYIAQKENIKVSPKTNKTQLANIVSSSLTNNYINYYIASIVSARY